MNRTGRELPSMVRFGPAVIDSPAWYSPLVISVLFSPYCVGATAVDSGRYIKKAFEFTQGEIDFLFRPGFIFLLGSAFELLEPSVRAGMILVRIFFVGNVFLIFFLALHTTRYNF